MTLELPIADSDIRVRGLRQALYSQWPQTRGPYAWSMQSMQVRLYTWTVMNWLAFLTAHHRKQRF